MTAELMGLVPDYLFDFAEMIHGALETYWPAALTPLPARKLICNGTVVIDAPCVAVAFGRMYSVDGDVSAEQWSQNAQLQRRAIVVEVSVIRAVADIQTAAGGRARVPTPQEQQDDARIAFRDAITVWNVFQTAHKLNALGTINGVAFQDWSPIGPEGGVGGGVTQIRALLV